MAITSKQLKGSGKRMYRVPVLIDGGGGKIAKWEYFLCEMGKEHEHAELIQERLKEGFTLGFPEEWTEPKGKRETVGTKD